jgi:hypothetical protein
MGVERGSDHDGVYAGVCQLSEIVVCGCSGVVLVQLVAPLRGPSDDSS